jgi:hypothetical protein
MKDNELMNAMARITSGIESERISSDIAVCSIAIPQPAEKTTLILVTDEGKDPNKYLRCFEAFLRFSAESCNVPAQQAQPSAQITAQQPGGVRTPGGQELKTWTVEELSEEAQKRMSSQPDMPTWSEEELGKFAAERGAGIPDGMEVWTEEELQELAKKRQGGLDIPEWEVDETMKTCVKCGYSLRPGWSRCPVCETPVGAKLEPAPEPQEEPSEESVEEPSQEPSEESMQEPSEESMQEPSEESMQEPSEESIQEPSEELTEEPIEEKKEEPSEDITSENENQK